MENKIRNKHCVLCADAVRLLNTPLGVLKAGASEQGILYSVFTDDRGADSVPAAGADGAGCPSVPSASVCTAARTGACAAAEALLDVLEGELAQYFAGTLKNFSVPLIPEGTEFQRKVWKALVSIPYGQTRSYIQLAGMISAEEESGEDFALGAEVRSVPARLARAAGNANGKNPIVIVIPCHRVIAANGGLGGYSGGLWRKEELLTLERGRL